MELAENHPALQGTPGPMVMVYIGDDDPSRGDSHGFKGIGKRMAQKLDGSFHYLEDKDLTQLYPQERSPENALKHYMADHGKPDILLSRYGYYRGGMTGIAPILAVRDINEGLSSDLLGERSLVAHHLTPELLTEQGKQFRENYKDITSPLIAVLMVNIRDIETFAQKMVSKCAAYEESTIFLCTSRRTSPENYNMLKKRLQEIAKEKGLEDKVKITGYNFHEHLGKENVFNPYVGLLDAADHVVVGGESLSMVSEPLAAGKPVILFEPGYSHDKIKRKGLAMDFNACAADTRFETQRITPVNVTEDIANKLIDKFKAAAATRKPGVAGWVARTVKAVKQTFGI